MGRPHLLLTLAALFWSGNWIAGRALAELVPPVALTFWRWVIALLLIAPVVGPRLWRQRALLRRHWKPIVLLGLVAAESTTCCSTGACSTPARLTARSSTR